MLPGDGVALRALAVFLSGQGSDEWRGHLRLRGHRYPAVRELRLLQARAFEVGPILAKSMVLCSRPPRRKGAAPLLEHASGEAEVMAS